MSFSRDAENLIARLRGIPGNRSRALIRQAVPLDNLVPVLQEQYKLNEISFTGQLAKYWPDVVGPQYAERCVPLRLDRKQETLFIGVNNPTLRQELYFNKREILKRLQTLPDGYKIKDVKFLSG